MRKKLDMAEKLKKLSKEGLPIFKPKKASDIEGREKEPPAGATGFPLALSSIRDLAIPESSYEMFSIEVAFDSAEKEKLMQLLALRENPEIKVKWTVLRDEDVRQFDWMKKEGLSQIRADPPVFARDFFEGALVACHIGDYTFSMAGHGIKVEELVELFISGLENAEKYELKAIF
jgi:hypothetical protein